MTPKKIKPRVLFNCTTNVVGGGAKNAFLFILSALEESSFHWNFAVSQAVTNLLEKKGVTLDESFHLFETSPAKNVRDRERLRSIASNNECDIVYTMAGPAYVDFQMIHVQGISNAYITHADAEAFAFEENYFKRIKNYLRSAYQFWFSRKADYFLFQTEVARNSFIKKGGARLEKTAVISNAFDDELKKHFKDHSETIDKNEVQVIFCPGANYIHKAFQYIPAIAKQLKERGTIPVEFILTLKEDELWHRIQEEASNLGVQQWIKNIGPFGYEQIIDLYTNADMVYVPSLLETFSASYLEAMAAQKPLIVSTKQFAKDVCGDYALYADPKNALKSADAIEQVLNGHRSEKHISDQILSKFGNQKQRFAKIVETLQKLLKEE